MKLKNNLLSLLSLCMMSAAAYAQSAPTIIYSDHIIPAHDAGHPCISESEYTEIDARCAANLHTLGLEHVGAQRGAPVQLGWPLRAANGLNDNSYYIISAYVDHDGSTGTNDWNCSTNTYDTHRGTDICTFPYPFYKMDHDQVQVVAAAAGTIIDKHDGEFDKNCVHSSKQANYVVLQHADGTFTNYFHMKIHSLTSKNVGETVAAGEFLGIVGSSGDANGPHLHFEYRTANNAASYKDPFAGGCNTDGTNRIPSAWSSQKPYTEPAILKVQIGSDAPVLASCPTTETPNDDACVAPGIDGRVYVFLRDETAGMAVSIRILDATGLQVSGWSYTSTQSQLAAIYGWSQRVPTSPGTYTLKATYNGTTMSRQFDVTSTPCASIATGVADLSPMHDVTVYPNPTNGRLTVSGQGLDAGIYTLTLRDLLGQTVQTDEATLSAGAIDQSISIAQHPDGMYFLTLEGAGRSVTRKVQKGQ